MIGKLKRTFSLTISLQIQISLDEKQSVGPVLDQKRQVFIFRRDESRCCVEDKPILSEITSLFVDQ